MATGTGKLTDLKCKSAPSGKHFDGGGLFLHVTEAGRYWRLKYRHAGKEKLLALGVYPEVTLSKARHRRDEARALVQDDRDPGAERQADKLRAKVAADNTFEAVAREWLELKAHEWTPRQHDKERDRLENHAFPWIGRLPVADIGVPEIRPLLSRVVNRGHLEQSHRLRHQLSRVFRYAVATERATRDPAADLLLEEHRAVPHPRLGGGQLVEADCAGGVAEVGLGAGGQQPAQHLVGGPLHGRDRGDAEPLVDLGAARVVDARHDGLDAERLARDARGDDVGVVAAGDRGERVGPADPGLLEDGLVEPVAGHLVPVEAGPEAADRVRTARS